MFTLVLFRLTGAATAAAGRAAAPVCASGPPAMLMYHLWDVTHA